MLYLKKIEKCNLDFPLTLIRQENKFVGVARNHALVVLNTDYVVFMDDDNYTHHRQIEIFTQAITSSDYAALSCICIAFNQDDGLPRLEKIIHKYIPLGSGLSVNLLANAYGDANGIFRRDTLVKLGRSLKITGYIII